MASSTSAKAAKDIMLTDTSTYYEWYNNIRDTVPGNFWRYFDPEGNLVVPEPISPVRPVDVLPPADGPEPPQLQKAREAQNKERLEIYYKDYLIYKEEKREWDRFYDIDSKLRERIKATISQQKVAPLVPEKSTREWLIHLRSSTAPPKTSVLQAIKVEYKKLVGVGLDDWPSDGPGIWLAKWEDLLYRSVQNGKQIDDWLEDVSLVWVNVKEVNYFFSGVEVDLRTGNTAQYSYASVSAEIQQTWERKKQGQSLRRTKPKSTRSAFTTQEAIFNGEEAPTTFSDEEATATTPNHDLDFQDVSPPISFTPADGSPPTSPEPPRKKQKYGTRKQNRGRRHTSTEHEDSDSEWSKSSKRRSRKQENRDPCIACDGSHNFEDCFLVRGKERSWITAESRKAFEKNMEDRKFKKRVEGYRKAVAAFRQ